MLETILLIAAFILGILLSGIINKAGIIKDALNKYLLYIGLPLLLYFSVSKVKVPLVMYLLVAAGILSVIIVVMYAIISRMRMQKGSKAALFLCSTFGNTAYLGIPLSYIIFGPIGGTIAGLVTVVTSLFHYSAGLFLSERLAKGRRGSMRHLLSPFLLLLIVTVVLALAQVVLPAWLYYPAHVSTYIAVFLIGISLSFSFLRSRTVYLSFLKLIVAPTCALFVFLLPIADPWPFVFLAAMPAAFLNTPLSIEYKYDEHLTSAVTTIGTVLFLAFVFVFLLVR